MQFPKVPQQVVSVPLEGGHSQRGMLSPVRLINTVALPSPGER